MPDEDRLSMLDRSAAQRPGRASVGLRRRAGRERRRVLVACAVLVLALHAAFIGGIGGVATGAGAEPRGVPMSVRTVSDMTAAEAPVEAAAQTPIDGAAIDPPRATKAMDALAGLAPRPANAPPASPRRAHEPAAALLDSAGTLSKASTDSAKPVEGSVLMAGEATAGASGAPSIALSVIDPAASETGVAKRPSSAPPETADSSVGSSGAPPGAPVSFLTEGEQPPPVYRTQLPPSVTLHYQVRRGFLRGTGAIRWQASGDRYRLVLEARIAGLTLLTQTSEGGIDVNGLAPVRFLDQRARRSAQAANFRRGEGLITYSGSGVEWPLLAGSQDRLSWMIQLAAIAAAEPEHLVEGGRITMAVVGARGDAGVWTLRYAGLETIETGQGAVRAVKLVRDGRSAYDTSAEIWLDPERSYLPARATLRNGSGASEFDLLLERVEPG